MPSKFGYKSAKDTSNGRELWIVSGGRDRTLKIWDCASLLASDAADAESNLSDEDEDDTRAMTSTDETQGSPKQQPMISLPCLATRIAHDKEINCITISPNSKLIATGSQDKSIRIWNSQSLQPIATLRGHTRGVWCLAFSTVDRVLASGSGDASIKLWTIGGGGAAAAGEYTCIKTLQSHTNNVLQVRFMNAGMQLLSCGADGLMKVWSIRNGECLSTYDEEHDGKIWAMELLEAQVNEHSDNSTVMPQRWCYTGGTDSVVHIWRDVTVETVRQEHDEQAMKTKKEQVLSNLINQRQFGTAILLALDLKQPRRLYSLLESLVFPTTLIDNAMTDEQQEQCRVTQRENERLLHEILCRLDSESVNTLLGYILDWNTNSRYAALAQRLLRLLFQVYTPQTLLSKCSVLRDHLPAFIAYTERHFARADALLEKSRLLDAVANRKLIMPSSVVATQQINANATAPLQHKGVGNGMTASNSSKVHQLQIVEDSEADSATAVTDDRALEQRIAAARSSGGSRILSASVLNETAQVRAVGDAGGDDDVGTDKFALLSNWTGSGDEAEANNAAAAKSKVTRSKKGNVGKDGGAMKQRRHTNPMSLRKKRQKILK